MQVSLLIIVGRVVTEYDSLSSNNCSNYLVININVNYKSCSH